MRTALRNPLVLGLIAAAFAVALYALISLITGGFTLLFALYSAGGAFIIGALFTLAFARRP